MNCPECGYEMSRIDRGISWCSRCGDLDVRGIRLSPLLVAAVKAADTDFAKQLPSYDGFTDFWIAVRRCAGLEEKRKVPK